MDKLSFAEDVIHRLLLLHSTQWRSIFRLPELCALVDVICRQRYILRPVASWKFTVRLSGSSRPQSSVPSWVSFVNSAIPSGRLLLGSPLSVVEGASPPQSSGQLWVLFVNSSIIILRPLASRKSAVRYSGTSRPQSSVPSWVSFVDDHGDVLAP